MNIQIICPLWIWLAVVITISVIGFVAGVGIHKTHLQIKSAPKAKRKPKEEPLPEGWERWKI